jgi:serine/threonine protein kinase
MSSWTGKTLGKVSISDLIARGGMAEVYLGEHTGLGRKVAVKIMRDLVDVDTDNRMRFEREARVVAGLRHPNIIQMYDYEIVDGQPCLIMEYIPGASLSAYLKALNKRNEKLPLRMAARILQSLASAIDYSHNLNIIHRDIKPANVLLRSPSGPIELDKPLPEDVEPVLTDFGLVRLLDSSIQTSTGTVSGTPAYMSPEQARGDKVDKQTDIYSFGVLMYEMLSGNVPFDAESSFGILMKHLNDPPPPIFGISSDLQSVIDRALAKEPNLRYQSARECADEFVSVFNGQTVSSDTAKFAKLARNPASAKAALIPEPPKRDWRWIAGGAVLLAAIIFAVVRFVILPPLNRNVSLGRLTYSDFNASMDRVTISITNLPSPRPGTHFEAWYLAQGGEVRRNIGTINMDGTKANGALTFTDPNEENLLGMFDHIEITVEPNNDPNPGEPSPEVVASSVFPPLALIHVRHLDYMFASTPDQIGLIQGTWFGAEGLTTTTNEMKAALTAGDEPLFRKKTEELINQIVGNANKEQYQDWDGDGVVSDAGDGYGLLQNGDPGYTDQGYIPQSVAHARFAMQSIDATENIKTQGAQVVTCLQNLEGWTRQLLDKAVSLQKMSFGKGMEPIVDEMNVLSVQVLKGVDSNNNQLLEPVVGECGADLAYEYAYNMAEMPLLPGPNRMALPAPQKQPQ